MQATISQFVAGMAGIKDRQALLPIFKATGLPFSTCPLTHAGLVITATAGKKVPKIGATDFYALIKGVLVKKAAGTDMAALIGTVTNAKFNIFCHMINGDGTLTTSMGTEGATLAAVKFPAIPDDVALLGITIINPTGTGNFVGNTTALDDATVVPNAVYLSPDSQIDPTILL